VNPSHSFITFRKETKMFSKTLAKKTLAVSASLALAFGGAFALSGSASAAGSAIALSFGEGDTVGTNGAVTAFEGGTSSIDDAPAAANGIGGDGKAFKFVKTGQPWSGANLILPEIVDTSLASKVTVDYYNGGSTAEPVMLKFQEDVWPNGGVQPCKSLEAAPGWNRLTFDMTTGTNWDGSKTYKVAAIFPNFGADDAGYTGAAVGAGNSTYFVDNVRFNGGVSVTGPSKHVLQVAVSNPLGQRVSIRVPGVRTWKSSGVGGSSASVFKLNVPSGTYKVTVTVGSQTVVKTQVVK
jgi:hypothetical protein